MACHSWSPIIRPSQPSTYSGELRVVYAWSIMTNTSFTLPRLCMSLAYLASILQLALAL